MPTSVLLAVLAAAGLLALAPALVRRYDATERLVAERAQSTARVLQRRRRRRTVPGRRPVNPPRAVTVRAVGSDQPVAKTSGAKSVSSRRSSSRRVGPSVGRKVRRRRPMRRPYPAAIYRRRRVLAALVLLNLVELLGVLVVGPGFWVSVSVTGTLLVVYVAYLRNQAIMAQRKRQRQAREAAWLAARQAEVRREQARRQAARREAQRRLAAQREAVRRAAMGLDRPRDLPAAAGGSRVVGASVYYRRAGGVRGRPYRAGRDPYSPGGYSA